MTKFVQWQQCYIADPDVADDIRRMGEVAKLFVNACPIVLAALISPIRPGRRMAQKSLGEGEVSEIPVDTPIQMFIERDPKGLYEGARGGTIKSFTGIDSPCEAPERADITFRTVETILEDRAQAIVKYLRENGYN